MLLVTTIFSASLLHLSLGSGLKPLLDVWQVLGSLHVISQLGIVLQHLGIEVCDPVNQLVEVKLCPGELVPSEELSSSSCHDLLKICLQNKQSQYVLNINYHYHSCWNGLVHHFLLFLLLGFGIPLKNESILKKKYYVEDLDLLILPLHSAHQ